MSRKGEGQPGRNRSGKRNRPAVSVDIVAPRRRSGPPASDSHPPQGSVATKSVTPADPTSGSRSLGPLGMHEARSRPPSAPVLEAIAVAQVREVSELTESVLAAPSPPSPLQRDEPPAPVSDPRADAQREAFAQATRGDSQTEPWEARGSLEVDEQRSSASVFDAKPHFRSDPAPTRDGQTSWGMMIAVGLLSSIIVSAIAVALFGDRPATAPAPDQGDVPAAAAVRLAPISAPAGAHLAQEPSAPEPVGPSAAPAAPPASVSTPGAAPAQTAALALPPVVVPAPAQARTAAVHRSRVAAPARPSNPDGPAASAQRSAVAEPAPAPEPRADTPAAPGSVSSAPSEPPAPPAAEPAADPVLVVPGDPPVTLELPRPADAPGSAAPAPIEPLP